MNKIDEKEIREIITDIKNDNIGIERLYKKYSKLIYGIVFCILKNCPGSDHTPAAAPGLPPQPLSMPGQRGKCPPAPMYPLHPFPLSVSS